MRIPILLGAPSSVIRSGTIPLPRGRFVYEVSGLVDSEFEGNNLSVVDGTIIEGEKLLVLVRTKIGTEKSITIFLRRMKE